MTLSSANTVVGIFESPQDAQRAVMDLKAAGFSDDKIGVVSRNQEGKLVGKMKSKSTDLSQGGAAGAATGAATGAGIGALWGVGILAGVLPGIGPAIAGGTLGVMLSSAAVGATAAGVAGTLIGLGISNEDAGYYETELRTGSTLVTVTGGAQERAAQEVFARHGGRARQIAEADA
jgi:hypothetical protein